MSLHRPPGYEKDVLAHGTINGDYLEIDQKSYGELLQKYRPSTEVSQVKGLGDVVYKFAQPIARGLDRVLGTHIEGCGGCNKRRAILNKLLPL